LTLISGFLVTLVVRATEVFALDYIALIKSLVIGTFGLILIFGGNLT
jgi:hypothetical protein